MQSLKQVNVRITTPSQACLSQLIRKWDSPCGIREVLTKAVKLQPRAGRALPCPNANGSEPYCMSISHMLPGSSPRWAPSGLLHSRTWPSAVITCLNRVSGRVASRARDSAEGTLLQASRHEPHLGRNPLSVIQNQCCRSEGIAIACPRPTSSSTEQEPQL